MGTNEKKKRRNAGRMKWLAVVVLLCSAGFAAFFVGMDDGTFPLIDPFTEHRPQRCSFTHSA